MSSNEARPARRPRSMTVVAIVAVVFGMATLQSGGAVLFGPEEARNAAGNVVPFVLWFNFLSAFVYVAAGVGLWRLSQWGFRVSAGLVLAIAVVGLLFGVHVLGGGMYETRTVFALIFRLVVWIAIAGIAWHAYARSSWAPRR